MTPEAAAPSAPRPAFRFRRMLVPTAVLAVGLLGLYGLQRNLEDRAILSRALVSAVQNYDEAAVARLLRKGADPNARVGATPPRGLWARIAQMLHIQRPKSAGDPVLLYAAYYDQPAIVRELLRHGADPRTRANSGETPLHWAVINRNGEMARTLLDANADPNAHSYGHAETPLHMAATRRRDELMRLLLKRGGDANVTDRAGLTPLMWATSYNDPAGARMLLDHGADPHRRDKRGLTAFDHARIAREDAAKTGLREKEAVELEEMLRGRNVR